MNQSETYIQTILARQKNQPTSITSINPLTQAHQDDSDKACRFDQFAGYQQLQIISKGGEQFGISSPFFRVHEGIAGATTLIAGREYINYASYNYLALSGDERVSLAAKQAIDQYGTSVSASRLVSGERPLHRQLETAIAELYGVDDAVVMVSGHATNVTTIGYLFGPQKVELVCVVPNAVVPPNSKLFQRLPSHLFDHDDAIQMQCFQR